MLALGMGCNDHEVIGCRVTWPAIEGIGRPARPTARARWETTSSVELRLQNGIFRWSIETCLVIFLRSIPEALVPGATWYSHRRARGSFYLELSVNRCPVVVGRQLTTCA